MVFGMVIGEGGRTMLLLALVVGATGSLMLARFLQGILLQAAPRTPITYITVTVVLSGTRVDPMHALRVD